MSVILKGIDLPNKGERYHIFIEKDKLMCSKWKKTPSKMFENYLGEIEIEAIQIPKDHGRLIDADLFKDIIKDSVPAYSIGVKIPTYGDMDVMDKIAIMPTILEEEK